MRLLYLIEEHHLVGLAPHGLGELSALVVADISWRRTDESRHAELLLVLTHVDTRHHRLIVKEVLSQCLGQLRLAHARGPQEDERPDGALVVLQSGTAATHRIAHGLYGSLLPYHTLVEFLLQVQQLLTFGGLHAAHGNARPAAHHVGDVICRHLLPYHLLLGLRSLVLLQFLLQGRQARVAYLGHPCIVAVPLILLSLLPELLLLVLDELYALGLSLLLFPLLPHLVLLSLQAVEFPLQLLQFGLGSGSRLLVRSPLGLTAYGLALYLQLLEAARQLIQFLGHGVALHAQFGGSLIHEVDGLVGEETLRDVAVGELHGRYDGIVLDTHAVVLLVAFLQASQDADAGQRVGFIDHDALETAFQGLVLLEVLLVLVQRGGTDAAQFAPGQGRLQYVGGIHGPLTLSGTHQRVYLVDEEDNLPVTLRDVLDDTLQTFLKLTLVLGTGYQGTHVQGVEQLALQVLGHVAPQDAVCQTLHDGCLSRTGFTDEDGVVLGTA